MSPISPQDKVQEEGTGGVGSEEDKAKEKDDDETEEAEQEYRDAKTPRAPRAPSKRQLEEHLPIHARYAAWCPDCVAGAGTQTPHRATEAKDEEAGSTVSIDYAFKRGEEDEDMRMMPTIVMVDHKSGGIWAIPVDNKGNNEPGVKGVVAALEEAGYSGTKVTLKSDQEELIMALQRAVCLARRADTVMIESPVRASKSNGKVERAVRTWRNKVRVLRSHLERRMGKEVPKEHPMMEWIYVWAAQVVTKFHVKENGKTAYEDMTGHKARHNVYGIGEKVQFMVTPDKTDRDKDAPGYQFGVFIGIIARTTEYLIAAKGQIFKCRSVRRLVERSQYDEGCLDEVKAGFREYVKNGAKSKYDLAGPSVIHGGECPRSDGRAYAPRKTKLRKDYFERFGYTTGCPGCLWTEFGIGYHSAHSPECRERMEKEMRECEDTVHVVEAAEKRIKMFDEEPHVEEVKAGQEAAEAKEGIVQEDMGAKAAEVPEVSKESHEEFPEAPMELSGEHSNEDISPTADAMVVNIEDEGRGEKRQGREDEGQREAKRVLTAPKRPDKRELEGNDHYGEGEEDRESKFWRLGERPSVTQPNGQGTNSSSSWSGLDSIDKNILANVLLGVDITEVYSPARVTQTCLKVGLAPGSAMDFRTGWNFDMAVDRRRAFERIKKEEPMLLIGSPPCTMFSTLQLWNKGMRAGDVEWQTNYQMKLEKATRHLEFCCSLYRWQISQGKHFLHEHPWGASSWKVGCIDAMVKRESVYTVKADMCVFGLTANSRDDAVNGMFLKKPTGVMTSSPHIAEELARSCKGRHEHTQCKGGKVPQRAAEYTEELCEAICRGLKTHLEEDMKRRVCSVPLTYESSKKVLSSLLGKPGHWTDTKHEEDGGCDVRGHRPQDGRQLLKGLVSGLNNWIAWDDVSGASLDGSRVKAARLEEMKYFEKMKVYTRVSRDHQKMTGGKIINVRWVDVNKGDSQNPVYRSRLVGQEFNNKPDNTLYASTPPLEALRYIMSHAGSYDEIGHRRRGVLINDVSRA